jgi:hypothetical protein
MLIFGFFDSAFQRGGERWRSLREARPNSRQHYPLNLPASLGEYDLTDPAQAAPVVGMARRAGLDGFVIDAHWRDGAYRHDAALLAPFCKDGFGLALRWQNGEEALWADAASVIEMEKRVDALIAALMAFPAQMIGGRVPLIIDQPKHLAAPEAVVALLRRAAENVGLPGLYLIANRAEDKGRFLSSGFDALIDPSPSEWHSCKPSNKASSFDFLEVLAGLKDSSEYLDRYFPYLNFAVARMLKRDERGKVFPRVFPAFHDWLLHKDGGATQLVNSGHRPADPHWFGMFLENAMMFAQSHFPEGERAVFLQSWNGWLEGSQIEPSLLDGDLLFNATRAAIDRGRYMIRIRAGAQVGDDVTLNARIAALCDSMREVVTSGKT